jgi:hypothetical protein
MAGRGGSLFCTMLTRISFFRGYANKDINRSNTMVLVTFLFILD